jgi:5-hydroxyisourate hydrolase
MSAITTHVLDTAMGRPAAGVHITLERWRADAPAEVIGEGVTDYDGRLRGLAPPGPLVPGMYRLRFDTGAYYGEHELESFYPEVVVNFWVRGGTEHYHVPLLLSPFGYTTYRGS